MLDIVERLIVERAAELLSVPAEQLRAAVGVPPGPGMGEYALACFVPAKAQHRRPDEVASELASRFGPTDIIREARAVGPYVNFFVRPDAYLSWMLGSIAREGDSWGRSDAGAGKTVIIEFSSPNIAKPLNVHHLRPTMIGSLLCRVFRTLGYNVVAINHLGDWGTQFGQLIAAYERYGGAGESIAELNKLYVRFHAEAEENPELMDEGRKRFRMLEEGDPKCVELWRRFCEVSLAEFRRTYDLLGVTFDSFMGESAYTTEIDGTLQRLRGKGLALLSQGATIVDLDSFGMPPCLLLKSDGATTYAARDLAAAEYRHRTYNFDLMLYIVGSEQRLHFRQVFKTLELMGHDWASKCAHVDFGLMRFKQEKMSSRKGTGILLDDLVQEAIRRVEALIEAKNAELADKRDVARMVGIGAVVFANLKSRRVKGVDFDWEEALSFEGETGPYLQYTHARLCSIVRKSGRSVARPEDVNFALLSEPAELQLGRKLSQYGAALALAAEGREPSALAVYLLELAAAVNNYYHKHRVILDDAELSAARMLLVDCARQALANGLAILGIGAPEEM